MLVASNFEQHAARLVDASISPAERRKLAVEVREAIEVVHSQDYGAFLEYFLPAFVKVLTIITKPQWENNDTHKTRSIILEVMSRLPHNEVLKSRFQTLLPLAMNVMQADNEENSVTAIHIVFDLHKTYRPHLESQVGPFLRFVRDLYSSLSSTVEYVLVNGSDPAKKILPASKSFKVITECPLVVMFVFQLYPRCIKDNIQALLPLMLKAIQIPIPSQPNASSKPGFKDFIAAQVKTVTFLVYLLKQAPSIMNFDENWIPQSVVQLLKACPGNAIAIRKELLVATRHMLGTQLRKGFFPLVDALLDEKVIAGLGKASTDALRPLGYQFLAELIHGVRFDLQLPQLHSIITMFSTNLHDSSFTFALQTNAVRLLLNLVEGILRRKNSEPRKSLLTEPRKLLVRIMRTMVAKYVEIGDQVPRLLKLAKTAKDGGRLSTGIVPLSAQSFLDPLKEVKDCRVLLKTLTLGLKTVVWSVINVKVSLKPPPAPRTKLRNDAAAVRPGVRNEPGNANESMILLEEEREVLAQLLPASRKCFKLFCLPEELRGEVHPIEHTDAEQPEKEIFDQFAQIFTILDVRSFQDIFGLRMQPLLSYIVESPNALVIAQHFLSNQNVAKYFADILLGFVVEKLPSLAVARPMSMAELSWEQKQCNALLSLFKSLFCSIPNSLEHVLRLHVTPIVRKSIALAMESEDPYFYLQLLRCLFKSLTGGKKNDVQFDALFRDFMPLVEPVLSGLISLCKGPHRLVHEDVIIELCLLVPARPATLFPYLHIQITPILWALRGCRENVQYGLRALDFWLEILHPSYIETLLESKESEINYALHSHLRVHSGTSFGTAALRIIGKLGARSRRTVHNTEPFVVRQSLTPATCFRLNWLGCQKSSFELGVDELVYRACMVVIGKSSSEKQFVTDGQRRIAWEFCRTCIAPYFGFHDEYSTSTLNDDEELSLEKRTEHSDSEPVIQLPVCEEIRPKPRFELKTSKTSSAEVDTIRSLLTAIIVAASFPDTTDSSEKLSSKNFALGLSTYFGVLCGISSSPDSVMNEKEKSHISRLRQTVLRPDLFLDAVLEVMSHGNEEYRKAGTHCLEAFVKSVVQLEVGLALYFVVELVQRFCHLCYVKNWYSRFAGARGICVVLENVPEEILRAASVKSTEAQIVDALLVATEEPTSGSRYCCPKLARSAILKLLVLSHSGVSESVRSEDEAIVLRVARSLVSKLTSRCAGTRELVKEALTTLSQLAKQYQRDLMQLLRSSIFGPLRSRSLRQLHLSEQIATLDAVTYSIGLHDSSVAADVFSPPLRNSLLAGVLAIPDDPNFEKLAEAEDGVRHKLYDAKHVQSDFVTNLTQLRFHAVKFLTALSLNCSKQLESPENGEIFGQMITIFFKCLQSRDEKMVLVAKSGLKEAITRHQKPKETLQSNLRPILSNLADYKKLSLPYLEGLSRILELLSHWFNVNLGDKLLEHLMNWTEPHKIVMLKRGHPGTESRIAAAILDLFHFLPAAAAKFLAPLLETVSRLEFEQGVAGPGVGRLGLQGRGMASISPYREPLLKFCNKHNETAVAYFLKHLGNPHVKHLFFVLLRADKGTELRSRLRTEMTALLNCTFNAPRVSNEDPSAYHGIVCIEAILFDAPSNWLTLNPNVLKAVVDHWNTCSRNGPVVSTDVGEQRNRDVDEYLIMTRILMRYCEQNLPANSALFSLLWVFGLRIECDFSFVKDFLFDVVSKRIDASMKKSVLSHYLDCFSKSEFTQEWKVNGLQMIVIPMLKEHLYHVRSKSCPGSDVTSQLGNDRNAASMDCSLPQQFSDDVFNTESLGRVVKELFDRPDEVLRTYDETLSAELLQLSTVLIQYLPAQVGSFRKELIKFGWAHLKREESVAKHWAFVNVSRFFQAYQAPPKIILQVYVALLRAVQSESKALVRLALDILTPALPRRLEHNPNDAKCPIWIRYTKKVLLEEGHSVVNLVHIWHLIVRHADLFFVARAQFVPIMVTSLPRIGNQGSNCSEYRRVALDLARLIISWQQSTPTDDSGGQPATKRRRVESGTSPDHSMTGLATEGFKPTAHMISATISFLTQLPFRPMERRERDIISRNSVDLVEKALSSTQSIDWKLISFEKFVDLTDNGGAPISVAKSAGLAPAVRSNGKSSDGKNVLQSNYTQGKPEGQKSDIQFHRRASVRTALELCVVFAKYHCVEFVRNKLELVQSFVTPVLSGHDPIAADLLGNCSLHLIQAFPFRFDEHVQRDAEKNASLLKQKVDPAVSAFFSSLVGAIDVSLRAESTAVNHLGLVLLKKILTAKPIVFTRFREILVKLFSKLVKDTVQQNPSGSSANKIDFNSFSGSSHVVGKISSSKRTGHPEEKTSHVFKEEDKVVVEGSCKTLCLSLLGANITSLDPSQRKAFIQGLCFLIERCVTVEVLFEVVRIVSSWATWRQKSGPQPMGPATKEPLVLKEKAQLLLKMIVFERISGSGARKLMNSYLEVILVIFGSKGSTDRRPELLPKLERAFLIGLNSRDPAMRSRFFRLFDASLIRNPLCRLHYIIARQDWSHLVEAYWIKHAVSLLIHAIDTSSNLLLISGTARFPRLSYVNRVNAEPGSKRTCDDKCDIRASCQATSGTFCAALQELVYSDDQLAYHAWVSFFPRIWEACSVAERSSLESSFGNLLLKEYHIFQCTWQRNVIQALLDGAFDCRPRPQVYPELLLHLGSRWNVWFTAVNWLTSCFEYGDSIRGSGNDEGVPTRQVLARFFDLLNEKDYFLGLMKQTSNKRLKEALSLEQRGRENKAQELYAQVMQQYQCLQGTSSSGTPVSKRITLFSEVILCQGRWIHCAKELCQWEILTEFSRSIVKSDLLHECLWRAPDWSAMKELLYRHPVDDGPRLRLYQAYIHLQENKLDSADSSITMGFKKSVEKYCSLPSGAGFSCISEVLAQFQQLVELEESTRILQELNALSRLGNVNVNVEQKIEAVKNILSGWRERLPSNDEPLSLWNNVLCWRNHVHAVVVNVLETLKEAANAKVVQAQTHVDQSQVNNRPSSGTPTPSDVQAAYAIAQSLPQHVLVIGVNETAWNIHRFARACRKQGQPDVAIHALLKLYPFGTMELSEYFVKTMESSKSFLLGPSGVEHNLDYGLNELNRCNMDHFNPHQKAQLFALKGKFYSKLGTNDLAVDSFSVALSLSSEVAAGWLGWATYCDQFHSKLDSSMSRAQWRLSAIHLYVHSIRCGSRKARRMVSRLLRLISMDGFDRKVWCEAGKSSQNSTGGVGGGVLAGLLESIPVWVLVPWIDQVISMLKVPEQVTFSVTVLGRIMKSFPQAVFFAFRSLLEECAVLDARTSFRSHDSDRKTLSALAPVALNSATVTRQLEITNESLKRVRSKQQETNLKLQRLKAELTNCNPSSAEFRTLRTEYTKTRDDANKLTAGMNKLVETHSSLRRRQNLTSAAVKQESSESHLLSSRFPFSSAIDGSTVKPGNQSRAPAPQESSSSVGGMETSLSNDQTGRTQFDFVDWLLTIFARSNRMLYAEMNRVADEMEWALKPSTPEVCNALITALLPSTSRLALSNSPVDSWINPLITQSPKEWLDHVSALSGKPDTNPTSSAYVRSFISELDDIIRRERPVDWNVIVDCLRKWKRSFQQITDFSSTSLKLEDLSRRLVDSPESDVEMFGQYNLAEAEEIRTDSHVRISSFDADVFVVRSQNGVSLCVQVVGSDGTDRCFTVEASARDSISRQEALCLQTSRLVNRSIFSRHAHSARRKIRVDVPVFVPLGRRSCVLSFEQGRITLAQVYEAIMDRQGLMFDDTVIKFLELLNSLGTTDGDGQVNAYQSVCKNVPEDLLSNVIVGSISNPNHLFMFRKRFAETIGTNNIFNHIIGCGRRRPENVAFSWNTGMVMDFNSCLELDKFGRVSNNEAVPFRLTRNLCRLMGSIGREGPLFGSMSVAFEAVSKHRDLLKFYLDAILGDVLESSIVRWPEQRKGKQLRLKTSNLSSLSLQRRAVIVDAVLRRTEVARSLTEHLALLSANSIKPENLATMDATWQPWF